MYRENIEKLFYMDVREKKRIGSNIFKRVSTRKGHSNMSTMRVPTQKQQKELSGKVTTFNLNEILPYDEFSEKSKEDKITLMNHWRKVYKTSEIQEKMNVHKNLYYRILDKLGIERVQRTRGNISSQKVEIPEEELQRYLEDSENYIEFEKFRNLIAKQQDKLYEFYYNINNQNSSQLNREWENSDLGLMYYVKSRITRNKEKEQARIEEEKRLEREKRAEERRKKQEEEALRKAQEEFVKAEQEAVTVEVAVAEEPSIETSIETPSDNDLNEPTEKIEPITPNVPTGSHIVNITMDKEVEENTFQFTLKGNYTKDAVIRRLALLMEELQDSEEVLAVNISIKG